MRNGLITSGELASQLKTNTSTLIRDIDAGKIDDADERTKGGDKGWGHRRWKVETAIRICEAAGAKVPKAWRLDAEKRAGGAK